MLLKNFPGKSIPCQSLPIFSINQINPLDTLSIQIWFKSIQWCHLEWLKQIYPLAIFFFDNNTSRILDIIRPHLWGIQGSHKCQFCIPNCPGKQHILKRIHLQGRCLILAYILGHESVKEAKLKRILFSDGCHGWCLQFRLTHLERKLSPAIIGTHGENSYKADFRHADTQDLGGNNAPGDSTFFCSLPTRTTSLYIGPLLRSILFKLKIVVSAPIRLTCNCRSHLAQIFIDRFPGRLTKWTSNTSGCLARFESTKPEGKKPTSLQWNAFLKFKQHDASRAVQVANSG